MKNSNSMPTMKDVAKEAGVALGTVSKVINGLPVGESYRLKVEAAAKKLGYQVNNYARGLKTNKTYTIALIIPSLIHPYFSLLTHELTKALAQRNYRTMLLLTDFDPQAEQACIQMMQQNKVDGAIGLTYNPNLKLDGNLPFVAIDRYFSSTVPCVAADNFGGGRMAAEKLNQLGCKKLAFLRTASSVPGETDKRRQGFESYCISQNLDYEILEFFDAQDTDPRFEQYLREHLVDGKLTIDGIFCGTDRMAFVIRNLLEEMGVSVPGDVQIIGFDGLRRFGDQELHCSTIVQPVEQIAQTCVNLVLTEDRSAVPAMICLPVSYAAGGTTRE
ncbi:MAG: LacI family DNA-binding transcriptional regulator [Oscillospiraceae bacterium]|nr:LacI family DNA-binding transcriptional regulator [Oscillospiraceae bacterium]